jgi:hypothetical protein
MGEMAMSAKIYLTVTEPQEGDATLVTDGLPLMRGEEDESLACGACNEVIFRGVSTRTVHRRFSTQYRLVVRCPCGAHNLIPSQVLG